MTTNLPFPASGIVNAGGVGRGWVWMVQVQVPSGVSTQTFTVAIDGTTVATLTGDQKYGPIALVGTSTLTISGGQTGQDVQLTGNVFAYSPGPPPPPMQGGLVFNVLDYGADPTGAQDSTAAIQSAWNDAVAAGGGDLFFGPGLFGCEGIDLSGIKTSTPVTISIRGAGMFATTLQVRNTNSVLGINTLSDYTPQLIVSDLTLDGNYSGVDGGTIPQASSPAQALVALGSPAVQPNTGPVVNGLMHYWRRVRFYRAAGYGFQPLSTHDIRGCLFDSGGQPDVVSTGLHWDNLGGGGLSDSYVVGNFYYGCAGNFIDLVSTAGSGAPRVTFTNNRSLGHIIGGVYALGVGSIIQNNHLDTANPGSSGIAYDASTDSSYRSNNIVSDNVVPGLLVFGTDGASPQLYNDIVAHNQSYDNNLAQVNGTSAGYVRIQPLLEVSESRIYIVMMVGYENTTATAQSYNFPWPYSNDVSLVGAPSGVTVSGTTLTFPVSMTSAVSQSFFVVGQ